MHVHVFYSLGIVYQNTVQSPVFAVFWHFWCPNSVKYRSAGASARAGHGSSTPWGLASEKYGQESEKCGGCPPRGWASQPRARKGQAQGVTTDISSARARLQIDISQNSDTPVPKRRKNGGSTCSRIKLEVYMFDISTAVVRSI